jgi:hypothetical protein
MSTVTGKRVLPSSKPAHALEIPVYTYADDKETKKTDVDSLKWDAKKAEALAKSLHAQNPRSKRPVVTGKAKKVMSRTKIPTQRSEAPRQQRYVKYDKHSFVYISSAISAICL